MHALIDKLSTDHHLRDDEYLELIENRTPEAAELLAQRAVEARQPIYGTTVFTRGLIEISNICKNDCIYCGIRRSNQNVERYRLEPDVIVSCAQEGYALGFRTIVLQGGEDAYFNDKVLGGIVERIVATCPDTAVTLSMGERSHDSYQRLFDAGASRYLLTAVIIWSRRIRTVFTAMMRL
jgi:biotin synthase